MKYQLLSPSAFLKKSCKISFALQSFDVFAQGSRNWCLLENVSMLFKVPLKWWTLQEERKLCLGLELLATVVLFCSSGFHTDPREELGMDFSAKNFCLSTLHEAAPCAFESNRYF